MKLIYILLVHTNTPQITRLVERLNTPQTRFVIHVSKNSDPGVFDILHSEFKDTPNIAFANATQVKWGNFDIIQALLNCLDLICAKGYEYDLAYILSGQDYPLQSNAVIQQTLARYAGQQIMEYFPLPDDMRGHGQNRWKYYHFWLKGRHLHLPLVQPENFVTRLMSNLTSIFLPKREIPDGFQLYGGSFWSGLTPQAVVYLQSFAQTQQGKKIIHFFKHNLHPGEMFLQSVLLNSPLKDTLANINLHYVKFPPDSGHPAFFTVQDFDELAAQGELFARKIDSRIDAEILDLLDKKIQTG